MGVYCCYTCDGSVACNGCERSRAERLKLCIQYVYILVFPTSNMADKDDHWAIEEMNNEYDQRAALEDLIFKESPRLWMLWMRNKEQLTEEQRTQREAL